MEEKFCINCKYHSQDGHTIWSHICGHPELERLQAKHPVTGLYCWMNKNDLGDTYYTDQRWPYCIRINKFGDCKYWTAKDR